VAIAPTSASCNSATSASFASQLVDILSCSAISNASISAIGADGVPYSGAASTSASDGAFAICLPFNSSFSIQAAAALYPTTYYAELLNTEISYLPQLPAISQESLNAFSAFFPGGLDPDGAVLLAKLTGSGSCRLQQTGWTFEVQLPDGGPIPDGGYQLIYLGASDLPDAQATETAASGAALIYNIDTSLADFLVVTATNPDAGSCLPQNGSVGFTGRVYVAESAVSIDPILLP
jgi:hypothetical protein